MNLVQNPKPSEIWRMIDVKQEKEIVNCLLIRQFPECPETSQTTRNKHRLNVGRIQHDAERGTEGLWWKVGGEFRAYYARITMWPGDLAPDHPDL